jgi:hypothetical protein
VGGLFQSLLYSAYERVRVEFGPDNLVKTAALYTYTVVAYERDMLPSGSPLDRVAQILGMATKTAESYFRSLIQFGRASRRIENQPLIYRPSR